MKITIDNKERLKILCLFLLQSYKVIMGSLLLLFVPRSCGENQICTIQDNLNNRDFMNLPGLTLNFLAFFSFFITYIVELRRENWLVEHFDIDHNKADNNLAIVLTTTKYSYLKKPLYYHNKLYYRVTIITFTIYFINFILSNIILFKDNIFWNNGLTAYFSYILLILMKLYNCYYISLQSLRKEKGLSAYITEFSSFNVLDGDVINGIESNQQNFKKNTIETVEARNIILP